MKYYSLSLLFAFCVGIALIAFANARFTGLNILKPEEFAYQWQRRNNGITSTGSNRTRYFKYYHLFRNSSTVKVAVVGSSRVLGITEDHFDLEPFYNFGNHGNPLACGLHEALTLIETGKNLELLIVGVDSLSELRLCSDEIRKLLSGETSIPEVKPEERSIRSLLSLANTRLSVTWMVHSFNFGTFVRQEPFKYACEQEDRVGLDLAMTYPGLCDGFRPDGSETFYGSSDRNGGADSHFSSTVNEGFSTEIQDLIYLTVEEARAKDIKIVFLFTPMKPGQESHLVGGSRGDSYLQTKNKALGLFNKTGAEVIDAIGSENFGCSSTEFADSSHPLPACYSKVLGKR